MTSPEAEPGLERFGFWTTSPSGRIEFPKPGGDYDPMTPLFTELWESIIVGRHSDRDGDGVADEAEKELEAPDRFAQDDGSVYQRVNAEEFESADFDPQDTA